MKPTTVGVSYNLDIYKGVYKELSWGRKSS